MCAQHGTAFCLRYEAICPPQRFRVAARPTFVGLAICPDGEAHLRRCGAWLGACCGHARGDGAAKLRREILLVAAVLVLADGVAATECIRLVGHPSVRMAFALAIAILVAGGSSVFGLRLERELIGVRGEAARVLLRDDL